MAHPSEADLWSRTRRVFSEVFDDVEGEQVISETTAADIEGWDSVSNIELIVALEREFGVRFNTGEMAGLQDVGKLVERIKGRVRVHEEGA